MRSMSWQFCSFSGGNVLGVRKLHYMITVIWIMVLKLYLLVRDYSFLESELKINITFMNFLRWLIFLICPWLRKFLWCRTFTFKTGKIGGKGMNSSPRVTVTCFVLTLNILLGMTEVGKYICYGVWDKYFSAILHKNLKWPCEVGVTIFYKW